MKRRSPIPFVKPRPPAPRRGLTIALTRVRDVDPDAPVTLEQLRDELRVLQRRVERLEAAAPRPKL